MMNYVVIVLAVSAIAFVGAAVALAVFSHFVWSIVALFCAVVATVVGVEIDAWLEEEDEFGRFL